MLAADARLTNLDRFTVSPIIGIHMWFAPAHAPPSNAQALPGLGPPPTPAPVMTLPHLILTRSPLHWVFNKGFDPEVGGQHLHGVISAAHDLVDEPAQDIIEMATAEVRRFLPGARAAQLIHAKVIKEKRATFSACPGVEAPRPPARADGKGVGSLFLAGDWCRTGWPATMEGATRSGYLAAAAVLGAWGQAVEPLPVSDLEPSALVRLLSR